MIVSQSEDRPTADNTAFSTAWPFSRAPGPRAGLAKVPTEECPLRRAEKKLVLGLE